jgi:putative CocE/NonD family hydrolase
MNITRFSSSLIRTLPKHLLPLILLPILILFLIPAPSLFCQQTTHFSIHPTYTYTYREEMVPGGDGFKLFTRIYLPEGEGPWPVVMTRTPYTWGQTTGDNLKEGQEYAKRGLGFIQQYCRGKGGSEGFYRPYEYERADGLAMVNWLNSQTWCKSIGIFGASYTAATGWIVADSLPTKVKGLYLHHYGVDRFISAYKDGLFRQDILSGWAIDNASEPIKKPKRDPDNPYYELYRYMPQVEMDTNQLGAKLPWYRDWITHTNYSDPYWNQGFWYYLKRIPAQISVPVTIVSGLYDHHLEGTLLGYERLHDTIRAKSRLILGSWNHSYQITPLQHSQSAGNGGPKHARDINVFDDQFAWLYSVVALGVVPKGEVKAYFIEEDKWVTLDTWPIQIDGVEKYYFTTQKDAGNSNAYVLAKELPQKSSMLFYMYDPQNPVISNGGETLFTSMNKRGSKQQKEPGYRSDVISFLSPLLTKDLVLAGRITVQLTVSTDVDDTPFACTVSEVMPDGTAWNIRSGITTLAYRNNPLGDRQTYTPNTITDITIQTVPVTWNVKAGNRIRVDITSSNFPEYSIHSNYAGIWAEQTKTRVAEERIFIGGEYQSWVEFPVLTGKVF